MNQKRVVIIGAGGFAHELLDLIDAVNQDEPQYEELGYIVDPQYGSPGTVINEKQILRASIGFRKDLRVFFDLQSRFIQPLLSWDKILTKARVILA